MKSSALIQLGPIGETGKTMGVILLRRSVKDRSLTYLQAAELAGLTKSTMTNYLSGHGCPPRHAKVLLQKVFGVPVDAWSRAVES